MKYDTIVDPVTSVPETEPLQGDQEHSSAGTPEAPPLESSDKQALEEELRKLRSEYGRQSNEVGELRAIVRQLMLAEKPKQQEVATAVRSDLASVLGEEAASVIEARLARAEALAAQSQREAQRAQLARIHPDYEQLVKSEEFAAWCKEKPFRARLFERADSGDLDAADELLSLYKERRKPPEIPAAVRGVRSAASAPKPAKKIWTSVEIGKLYLENPAEYRRLHSEIEAAYREGRVK